MQFAEFNDRVSASRSEPDYFNATMAAQDCRNTFPHHGVIIDAKDANRSSRWR
jgi:hypothetical protein